MDIESFLSIEKCRLTQEYERLQYFKKRGNSIEALDNESVNVVNNDVKRSNKSDNNQYDAVQEDYDKNENHKNGNGQDKDHMEQWVTNTFYSYFPGYNDEYHKRQRARFQEHKDMESIKQYQKAKKDEKLNDSSTSSLNLLKLNDRVALKKSTSQPESARHKHLRDLCHTDLSTILNSNEDDLAKLKRQEAELALAKQKEYQLNLLQQIEEKRHLLEALKEKEEKRERESVKRLEKQLVMMKMEEQRERERERDRERINASRQLAFAKKLNGPDDVDKNKKVYKYFSSYSKKDVNDSIRSHSESLSEIDLYEITPLKTEKECFHLSEKICPMCNGPLREFQNFCLHCQKKLLLGLKRSSTTATRESAATTVVASNNNNNDNKINNINKTTAAAEVDAAKADVHNDIKDKKDVKDYGNGNSQNCSDYSLVCCNCYRFYTYCTNCASGSGNICRACQRKRNVCMQCRRDLCSFCLEEIACGKDVEQTHVNDLDKSQQTLETKNELSSKQILLGLGEGSTNDSPHVKVNDKQYNNSSFANAKDYKKQQKGDNLIGGNDDSIRSVYEFNDIDGELNMERMHRDIEKRLVLFFKHYGDLIRPKRNHYSVEEFNRRKHSLSMPKLTRQDISQLRNHM